LDRLGALLGLLGPLWPVSGVSWRHPEQSWAIMSLSGDPTGAAWGPLGPASAVLL